MKSILRHLRAALGGSSHGRRAVVTSRALGARDKPKVRQALVLLMTCRTGAILDNVRFVKTVALMTNLAFAIDRFDANAVAKAIPDSFGKCSSRARAVVAFCAIVCEIRVRGGDRPRVEKNLTTVKLK